MTYKPGKRGQTDLVSGLWSELISRSVHAITSRHRQRLWFMPPWLTHRQAAFDWLYS